jgi:hypothetical protein
MNSHDMILTFSRFVHVRVYVCLCSHTATHGSVAVPGLHQGNENIATAAVLDKLRKLIQLRKRYGGFASG